MIKENHLTFLEKAGFKADVCVGQGAYAAVYAAKDAEGFKAVKLPLGTMSSGANALASYSLAVEHLKREHEAYVRAHGIPGIPANSRFYRFSKEFFKDNGLGEMITPSIKNYGLPFVVRNFAPGESLPRGQCLDEGDRRFLEKVVRECHLSGMASLDIRADNVIVSPRRRPVLIDFGYVTFGEEIEDGAFEKLKEEDFESLKNLFVEEPTASRR